MNALFRKLRWLVRRSAKEAELREELQFHLEEETDQRREAGVAGDEARWAARRELGNLSLVQEDTRAAWSWTRLEQVARDARHGLRQVRRNRVFSAIAIATLALGIGGITATFSAFDAILGVVDEVLAVDRASAERAKVSVLARPQLSARDALHAAVMERHGIERILSFDKGFDGLPGVVRLSS